MLWKLFDSDPNAKRDFIYRHEPQRNTPAYYIVSKRQPVDNDHLWKIETKDYAPVLTTGQRFAFLLRVNPVITRNGRRHDVVMHEKHEINYKKMDRKTRPSSQEMVEKAGIKWIQSRAEFSGFSLDDTAIRIDGYQPHTSGRKRGSKEIRYSTMDFRGILTITDPEAFKKTIMQGIGKAKAFGCGLMLIRYTG
jgi:CRISPR system Cascade subunit CasE